MTDVRLAPMLNLQIDLTAAGSWRSESKKDGVQDHYYQWNPEQWKHIEMVAFRLLLVTMGGNAPWIEWSDCIPPEALDFWEEDLPDDLFSGADEPNDNEHINGCATAIGVVDCILKQMEEEIGKRGGSLP